MVVKIALWTGVDVHKYRYEPAESPMECLRAAIQEYVSAYGHLPSDARIKVR